MLEMDTNSPCEAMIRFLAMSMTNHKGPESLNRFAKLLVIGQMKDKGFEDSRNSNVKEVFDRDYICTGHFNALVRFSFLNASNRFCWDFASGNVVGKSTGENTFVSSKGRRSKWVGKGAEKNWKEKNITCVIMIGLDDKNDLRFYYLTKAEFLSLEQDKIIMKPDERPEWEKAWDNLLLQHTFSSMLSK